METLMKTLSPCFSNAFKLGIPENYYPSPAKLNLFLYITGRKENGYHELQTLFQFLDYGDWLKITVRQDSQIILLSELKNVATKDNLIYKAAMLLKQYSNCKLGADIQLYKHLPMGGGIGGGSSNAATTLLVLNRLWNLNLDLNTLTGIAVTLGADIPIFIQGYAAFAEGIGEKLTPASPKEKWYLVAKPPISIATADIFNDPDLIRNSTVETLEYRLSHPFINDCEKVVCFRYTEVEQLLKWLLKYSTARLTGTGACVFAEFETQTAAEIVLKQLPDHIDAFIAQGKNHSPLHILYPNIPYCSGEC